MVNVSIITPAFNVENYIEKFIMSVQKQKYTDWELIIIDDGSTDMTSEIVDNYALMDEKIKVYHKKNEGVSVARNVGLEVAKGKYIIFADADDELPDDSLEVRVGQIEGYSMLIGAYMLRDLKAGKVRRMGFPFHANQLNTKEAINTILRGNEYGYQGYLWNKIFRSDIIKKYNIEFEKGIAYNEDRLFCLLYALHCEKIIVVNEIVYIYLNNENGAMAALKNVSDDKKDKVLSEFAAYKKMYMILKKYDLNLCKLCALDAQERAIRLYKIIQPSCIKIRKELRRIIRKFGFLALGADFHTISFKKNIKIFIHAILMK
ncbi:MAG: glycosyltransferase family 2 protein [Clostridiales bacterium]|nr:glycosyltransferase family 2 protein [Clostridiales bacterium]